jgi:hypothetical protein
MSRAFLLCVAIAFACGPVAADDHINGTVEEAGDAVDSLEPVGTEPFTRRGTLIQLNNEEESPTRIRNGAVMWRPVPLIVAALSGGYEIAIQGQTAFTSTVGATGILSVAFVDDSWTYMFRVGPQYRFERQYLHGGLVGFYPGFGWATDGVNSSWMFASSAEFGYQWVLDSGFTVAVSTGPSLYVGEGVSFEWDGSIQVGIAFPDPLFRPR